MNFEWNLNFFRNSCYIKRPFIPIFIFFCAGIFAGDNYKFSCPLLLLIIFFNLIWLIYTCLKGEKVSFSPLLIFFLFGAVFISPLTSDNFYKNADDLSIYNDKKEIVTGVVSNFFIKSYNKAKTDLILLSYDGEDVSVRNIKVKLTIYNYKNNILPYAGDIIVLKTKFKRFKNFKNPYSFDYEAYMRHSGFYGSAWVSGSDFKVIGKTNSFSVSVLKLRKNLSSVIDIIVEDKIVSSFLKTITTGNKKVIDDDIRDYIIKSGSAHFMAISGLHIGMVFTFVFFVSRRLFSYMSFLILKGWLEKASLTSGLISALFYSLISGMMPSAQRAVIILLLGLLGIFLNKKIDPLNILFACGFFILLINPGLLFSLGFIFSFTAVFFIISGFSILPEKIDKKEDIGLKTKLKILIKTNFFAVLGTYPLGLYFFNILPFYGIFTGVFLIPVFSIIILPFAFIGISFFYILKPVSKIFFLISGFGVEFFLKFSNIISNLKFSYFYFGISLTELFLIYFFIFLNFWVFYRYKKTGGMEKQNFVFLSLLAGAIFLDVFYVINKRFYNDYSEVLMFDTGKGNSALIKFYHGKTLLIDAGGFATSDFDTGKFIIAPILLKNKIKTIDYAVVTHGHADHYKGFFYLIKNFHIKNFILNDSVTNSLEFSKLRSLAIEKKILRSPDNITLNSWKIVFFQLKNRFENENDNSLIIKVLIDDLSILFTGDLLEGSQKVYKKYSFIEDIDIFMIPHHGSMRSLEKGFIKKADPKLAVISGNFKGYKKTHALVRKFYNDMNIDVYNINEKGCLRVKIKENKFKVINNN